MAKQGYICTLDELKKYLKLTPSEERKLSEVIKIHPMKITRYYASLINPKDKNDPIKHLIVPSVDELNSEGSYDVSGEGENTKSPGLQHKYPQTALILSTNRCAAYCRHCFRKRLVGLPTKEILNRFEDAINYIKKHKEIDNVLISGGDPLVLPTKIIEKFLQLLTPISHLKYIRFGSRVPVVLPERITKDKKLLEIFEKYRKKKKIFLVTHFCHPRELTPSACRAVRALHKRGIAVHNQAVLLKKVNDNPKVLAELFNKLIENKVLPYYLFQCRPVSRVKHHFQIPLERGYKIFEQAKKNTSGHILCRRFKYVMSHKTGKIEIIGILGNEIFFKYHQAKNPKDKGRFFKKKLKKGAAWLDDL